MEFFQLVSDLIASIVLYLSFYLKTSTKIVSYVFFIPVFLIFISIFFGNKKPEDAQFNIIDRLHVLNFLPQILSTGIRILLLVIFLIIGIRGIMLPKIQGEITYYDDYLGYSIQVPKNWVISYDKPYSATLDQYLTTSNVTLHSKDYDDYIFIGLLENAASNFNTIMNRRLEIGILKNTVIKRKISIFRDEIVGFSYLKGNKLLVSGRSDSAILRYFFSTLQ